MIFKKIFNFLGYVPKSTLALAKYDLDLSIKGYEKEKALLKDKELILYLVSEIFHNKEDRETVFSEEEVGNILSHARVFTPYYGCDHPDENDMKNFIESLSNTAWVKIFKKSATETNPKILQFFDDRGFIQTEGRVQ